MFIKIFGTERQIFVIKQNNNKWDFTKKKTTYVRLNIITHLIK